MSKKQKSTKSKTESTELVLDAAQLTARRKGDVIILLSVLAVVALIYWIVSGRSIGIEGEWTWPDNVMTGARYLPPVIAALLLIATAGWLTRPKRWDKTSRRGRAIWLIVLIILSWLMAVSLLLVPLNPVLITGGIIVSPQATSYYTVAMDIENLPAFLKTYSSQMATFPQHARTHPPGPILYFYLVERFTNASPEMVKLLDKMFTRLDKDGTKHLQEVLTTQFGREYSKSQLYAAIISAFLLAGVGSLCLVPLYFLCSSLYKPLNAIHAVLLFCTIPSFLLFAPTIDELVLLLALLCLWSFNLFRKRGNPIIGLFLALGLLMSLGFVAIGLLLALWWISDAIRRKDAGTEDIEKTVFPIRPFFYALGIFLAVFVSLKLAFGFDFIGVLREGLGVHRHTTLAEASRTYWKWVLYNPIEFAVFLGLPVTIWALFGLRGGLAIAWITTIILLDLSGWVRAETGRIWLFLMPPAVMFAAVRLEKLGKRFDLGFFTAFVLQIGQIITMKAALDIFILR